MSTSSAKSPRAVNVQVPGEAAPAAVDQVAGEAQPVRRTRPQEDGERASQEVIQERVGALLDKQAGLSSSANIPDDVMEAARAQARAELQQDIRDAQAGLQSASSVLEESDPLPPAVRLSYAKMRADDIDASKLTAPVMTLDGWLCPPAPEKK